MLFELVISPWPLVLWVVFRTVGPDRAYPLETLLNILRGPDKDIFAWDGGDDAELHQILVRNNQRGLYPQDWNRYMIEIDLGTWLYIRNKTSKVYQPRSASGGLSIRLAASSLLFCSELNDLQCIMAPLDIGLDQFPFDVIAHVANKDYEEHQTPVDVKSEEFWAGTHLRGWLLASSRNLCHTVWNASTHMSVLERVQCIHLILSLVRRKCIYSHLASRIVNHRRTE